MSEEKKDDRSAPTGEAPKGPVLKSPREWALELGHGPPKKQKHAWSSKGMSSTLGSMAYEVAAVLHGWREHEHHAGAPKLLTKEQFLAALEKALPKNEIVVDEETKAKKVKLAGNPEPHPEALSEHRGGGMRVQLGEDGKPVKFNVNEAEEAEEETP